MLGNDLLQQIFKSQRNSSICYCNLGRLKEIVIKNLEGYLTDNNEGLAGLNSFTKQLSMIRKLLAKGKIHDRFYRLQLKFILSFIREFESSHSLYRYMYIEFLNEIQERIGVDLSGKLDALEKAAGMWESLGKSEIRKFDDSVSHLDYVIESLSAIETLERESLSKILKKLGDDNDRI